MESDGYADKYLYPAEIIGKGVVTAWLLKVLENVTDIWRITMKFVFITVFRYFSLSDFIYLCDCN